MLSRSDLLTLLTINFIVVTKGAERISEVSARFTLDAMPGKQMAIDADLNAGLINQAQAQTRRKDVASEADFYGAMDGASKFVRGDAIAGMMILAINLIGGVCIGIFKYNLSADAAFQQYVLMTIGDGLVAQIPSLLLPPRRRLSVTRVSDPVSRDAAPFVVAKGTDEIALYIRQVAAENQVEVVEFPRLARSVYYTTRGEPTNSVSAFAGHRFYTATGARRTAAPGS